MDIVDLINSCQNALSLNKELDNEALKDVDSVKYSWLFFLHLANTQFDTLESVLTLVEKGKYKDCFTLLRSVFESTFFLMLMMNGKRFRESRRYKIIPKPGQSKEIARDTTLDKWNNDRKSGNPDFNKIVALNKENDDVIVVTLEDEGLFSEGDIERKGPVVTRYFFAFDEYDPETRFISELPSVSAGDPYPKLSEERLKAQKIIYHQYFYISNLEKNLKLNDLLSDEEADRFNVHYNFLSMYIHPTKPGTPRINANIYSYPYTPRVLDRCNYELIFLYVSKLQIILFNILVNYFSEINPKLKKSKYEQFIEQMKKITEYFWFIYEQPTEFDKGQSDYYKATLTNMGCNVETDKIIFYRNPLKHLADFRISIGSIKP